MIKQVGSKAAVSLRMKGRKVASDKDLRTSHFASAMKRAERGELQRRDAAVPNPSTEESRGDTKGKAQNPEFCGYRSYADDTQGAVLAPVTVDDSPDAEAPVDRLEPEQRHADLHTSPVPPIDSRVALIQGHSSRAADRVSELTQLADIIERMRSTALDSAHVKQAGSPDGQTPGKAAVASVFSLEIVGSKLGIDSLHLSLTTQGLWALRLGLRRGARSPGMDELDSLKSRLMDRGHPMDHVSLVDMN